MRYPTYERSLAAQEGALRVRHIKLKYQGEACKVYARSHTKICFFCTKCDHNFEASPNNINSGIGCPFCSSPPKQLCGEEECLACWRKSLASKADDLAARYLKYSGDQDARTVFVNQVKKALFTCTKTECGHDFEASPSHVNKGSGCPFCSSQKLCGGDCPVCWQKSLASKEDDLAARGIKFIGEDASRVFANSAHKLTWQCLDPACGSTWKAAANSVCKKEPSGCPGCGRHKTERMVAAYIKETWGGGDSLRADWCRGPTGRVLPYDIYVEIDFMGIIFEVDGGQHFGPHAHFNRGENSYETILEIDRYKQHCAMENGRHVVRMHQGDVLFGRIDWQAAIHHAVRECLASDRPLLQFIAADTSCYDKHTM